MKDIINKERLTTQQLRYWNSVANTTHADIVDPWRYTLKALKDMGYSGKTIYRASTGGRFGKSVQIRKVP